MKTNITPHLIHLHMNHSPQAAIRAYGRAQALMVDRAPARAIIGAQLSQMIADQVLKGGEFLEVIKAERERLNQRSQAATQELRSVVMARTVLDELEGLATGRGTSPQVDRM